VTGNLSGYPGDRGGGTEQWYMARRIGSVSARKVFYDIDTAGGQSGSAVYRIADGERRAVGIHAYGVGASPFNSATRINRPVFDNLQTWKAAHA
jgi:V8-like Glu-specific endopeptidase